MKRGLNVLYRVIREEVVRAYDRSKERIRYSDWGIDREMFALYQREVTSIPHSWDA